MRRFWHFITKTRRKRVAASLSSVAVVAVVAAIVGSGAGSATRAYASNETFTSASVETNVRVTVYSGEARATCEAINRGVAREAGDYWRV
jgi:hypothetical protein